MDDDAELLRDSDPHALIGKISAALNILTEKLSKYGLILNLGPGKTAAMLKFYGAGARKAYESLRGEGGSLAVPFAGGSCSVVHSYKHVGNVLQDTGRHVLDARAKASKAMNVYAPSPPPSSRTRR